MILTHYRIFGLSRLRLAAPFGVPAMHSSEF